MQALLQNYRTPQNINNNQLKELPGIHSPSNAQDLGGAVHYKKRNASGNHRNIMSMHNQNVGAAYIHGSIQGAG